ncbi:MAG: type VI secretion protein ImpB [Planctomycetia bacterium]|nr:type VI secretion protein ImpB [Planctomycetia bacterium]
MNWMWMDMNSYFASVEQALRPELRGRAVGVIPVEADSTCVIAASYDAKSSGVKVGTSVREARRLCPGITLVKARPKIYVEVHHRVLKSVDQCAEVHRIYSIDEWAFQLRGDDRRPEQAHRIAQHIKRQVREDFGPWMTCSIGIAPTRLLAKIASNLQKPDGLTALSVEDLPARLESLPLRSLYGISHGMLARLDKHGIQNVRELWQVSRIEAARIWGSVSGSHWWDGFHGHDEPELPTRRRSMSHGNVLEPRFRNEEGARSILVRLLCKLAQRLRRSGYFANSLSISVKEVSGGRFSAEIGLPGVDDTPTLLEHFHRLWQQRMASARPIIKVDVRVAGLVLASQMSRSLFAEAEKLRRLSKTLDEINERWGSSTLYFGPVHHYRQLMDNKIAFGRIPDEID